MVSMSSAKPEPRPLPKRFYTEAAAEAVEGGFAITLDGKKVKTPAKQLLQVHAAPLAAAIAAEWNAQHTTIDTDSMPLTRLAHIALDRVALDRTELLADINRYAETDLLCYRAPVEAGNPLSEDNHALRAAQEAGFAPVLHWAATQGFALNVTDGLMPIAQPQASLNAIAARFAAADNHQLAALAMLVPMLGSVLLPLALWAGVLEVDEACRLARLDEEMQAERWGHDMEMQRAWHAKQRDIRAACFFLTGK